MRTLLLLTCCVTLFAGCAREPVVETRPVVASVPAELRRPCLVGPVRSETVGDIAALIVAQDRALGCANGRIVAIDKVLTEAEARFGAR